MRCVRESYDIRTSTYVYLITRRTLIRVLLAYILSFLHLFFYYTRKSGAVLWHPSFRFFIFLKILAAYFHNLHRYCLVCCAFQTAVEIGQ